MRSEILEKKNATKDLPLRIRCFPLRDDELLLITICESMGLRFEMGGPVECDYSTQEFDRWGDGLKRHRAYRWMTCYIHCQRPGQINAVLTRFRIELLKLGETRTDS